MNMDLENFQITNFYGGGWLEYEHPGFSKFVASMIAVVAWYTWKVRCDFIFRHKPPNYNWIAKMAVEHVKEYSSAASEDLGKSFYLLNKPFPGFFCIYSAACWNAEAGKGGAGFCVIDTNACVHLAGCYNVPIISRLHASVKALLAALDCAIRESLNVQSTFVSCSELWRTLEGLECNMAWRSSWLITELCQNLLNCGSPRINLIPWSWNRVVTSLAGRGVSSVQLSLFHRSMERPRWLMGAIEKAGFQF